MSLSNRHPLSHTEQRLAGDGPWIGVFLVTGNSMLAEACGLLDLDWVVIDMEAGPMSKRDALHMLQAMAASSLVQLIRVPKLDRHFIEHALDLGAHGVLVPRIESGEQAALAADACRFPPAGTRGVNPIRASGYFTNLAGYFATAGARTICAVQVETSEGVDRINEIVEVPGVDVVFIGVGDLASSLGQPGVPDGPAIDEARNRVLAATLAAGKRPGIFAYSDELARTYANEGFELIAVGNEMKLFMSGCERTTSAFRATLES